MDGVGPGSNNDDIVLETGSCRGEEVEMKKYSDIFASSASDNWSMVSPPAVKKFGLSELRSATRNFRPDSMIGEGGFGIVYKGWVNGMNFAPSKFGCGMPIIVKKAKPDATQPREQWQNEVTLLSRFSHPNLVKLLGYCCEDGNYILVYEYMQKGSLENHLFKKQLSWEIRLKVAIGAARGLAHLHTSEKCVIYRDFKTSNILLDGEYNAKLSDFGLAKLGPAVANSYVTTTRVKGTCGYVAPECIATGHLYVKSDVYGFGVLLLEMLTGRRALDKDRPCEEYNLVEWATPFLTNKKKLKQIILASGLQDSAPPFAEAMQVANLVSQCLKPDPQSRPSMDEVVEILEQVSGIKAGKMCAENLPNPHRFFPGETSAISHLPTST